MPVSDLSAEGRRSWEEVSVLLTVTPLDTGAASFNHRILGTGEAYRRAESRRMLYVLGLKIVLSIV